jgi:hypothetical protein
MMRLKLQIHDHCTWSDTIDPSTLSTWWWVVKLGHVLRKAKMHKGRSCSVPLELWVRPSREALYQKEMQQQEWRIGLCHTVQQAILARWHLLQDVTWGILGWFSTHGLMGSNDSFSLFSQIAGSVVLLHPTPYIYCLFTSIS